MSKIITRDVEVRQVIRVTVDADKFDQQFMEEFRASFFRFDTIDEHLHHLAQLTARGIIDDCNKKQFVEGYGPLDEMGVVVFDTGELETDLVPEPVEGRPA